MQLRLHNYTPSRYWQAELSRRIVAIDIKMFQTQQRQYTYAAETETSLDEPGRHSSRVGLASTLLRPARPAAGRVASRVVIHRSCNLTRQRSLSPRTGGVINYFRRRTYVYVCRACHVVLSLLAVQSANF